MALCLINGNLVERMPDFHGHSVFTTMRSKDRQLLLWPQHWQRVTAHAGFFGYGIPEQKKIYRHIAKQLSNTDVDQKIRVILTKDHFALTFEPYQPPPSDIYRGVSVIVSRFLVHPQLAPFKTGNSLPYSLAHQEAEKLGAFEGLLLNHDGFVVDGSRTSLMLFDGETFSVLEGGLIGLMREEAITYAKENGFDVVRKLIKPAELRGQLLMANSLLGVVPVGDIQWPFIGKMVNHFRMDRDACELGNP